MIRKYIANQKFDSIRISVIRDIKKFETITHIKNVQNIYFA